MITSVRYRPAPGAAAARLVAVPPLRERAAGPTPTVRAHPDATGPATVLVRALPHAGPSARIGVPGVVHAALLALVVGQCVVLDAAGHGVPAGATLLVVALSGALLLRYGLARPVVAVRHTAYGVEDPSASATVTPLRPAQGERAAGGLVPPWAPAPPHSRIAELVRIRWTVLAVGARPSDTGARWCCWPAGAVVAGAVAPVLVWSVLVAAAPAPALVDAPVVTTVEQEDTQVAARAAGLLDTGLRALPHAAGDPADLVALVGRDGPPAGVRTRTPTLGLVVPGLATHQPLRRPVVPTVAATARVTATGYAFMVNGHFNGMVVAA